MPELFCSRQEEYRAPFGAVPAGTAVRFRICLPRDWGCHAAFLQVKTDDGATEQCGMFWAGMNGESHEWWDVHYTPQKPALYWYGFRLDLALGTGYLVRRVDGTAEYSYTTADPMWQMTCYATDFSTPSWLPGGIFYQIFPDRFFRAPSDTVSAPSDRLMHENWDESVVWEADRLGKIRNNDFFGGNLAGITEKLDYLAELGVTCLYLNPIFESPSNHRYDTADYTTVDPLLGNNEDFSHLAREAEKRGIRIVLDGVFSHTGSDSIYFNREGRYNTLGAYQSLQSPYASWYRFRQWPKDYACWWNFDTLPEVEETDPDFLSYITGEDGVLAHWLLSGASGWRLDVADELPDAFLDALRRRVKAVNPDGLVLGEVWEDASNKESYGQRRRYLLGNQLDSVMNYPFRLAVLRFLLGETRSWFFDRVMTVTENYPEPVLHCLMNPLGTHDTERALTALGGERSNGRGRQWQAVQTMTPSQRERGKRLLYLATLLQFSLPGVPCIYYGDEAGVEGYRDPFNRAPYPWGREDADLQDWYRRLGRARRSCHALKKGDFIPVASDESVVCYCRRGDGETFLCAVNRSGEWQNVTVPYREGVWEIVVGDGQYQNGCLSLPPTSGVWMKQ